MCKKWILSTLLFYSCVVAEQKTTFSNLIYFDLSFDTTSGSSFTIKRAYMNMQTELPDGMSFRFTSDVGRTSEDERLVAYLKYAYISWKMNFGTLMIGVQPTNYFGPTKKTYGYRFVEKYPIDIVGLGKTSDLGIGIKKEVSPNLLLHGAVYNGTGYKKYENDTFKRATLLISYGEQRLDKNSGYNTGGVLSIEPYNDNPDTKITTTVFSGFSNNIFRIGGENTVRIDSDNKHQFRLAVIYSNYKITSAISLFIRTDMVDFTTESSLDNETYTIIGLNYKYSAHMNIAPTFRYKRFGDKNTDPAWAIKLNFQFKT